MPGTTDNPVMGPGGDGYGWSKRTLVGYTEQMARHLASRFIRVNTIHPTNCNTHLLHNEGLYKIFRPDLENPTREDAEPAFNFFQAMPIPYVEPEDIANLALFLASDESALHHGPADPGRRRIAAQVPQRTGRLTAVPWKGSMHDRHSSEHELYYDPYDFDIDADPYPVWKRLRDEAPLYYNEKHDFYALSRFEDVRECSTDWKTYISGKGSVLELIKSGMEIPPGIILFEDPPAHDLHRSLLSRVFTPKRMAEIEPQARAFCARALDPLMAEGRFDFIRDLAAEMPMRVIGMLLGIPEDDQEEIRDRIDEGMRLDEGEAPDAARGSRPPRRQQVRRLHRLAGRPPVRRPHDRVAERRVRGRQRDRPGADA